MSATRLKRTTKTEKRRRRESLTSLNNTDVPCRDSPPLKPLDRKGPKADVTAEGSETYWERIEEES